MRACPQPIIALVHGAAAGGGLAMALAADVIVVGRSATFHPAFIKIGLSGTELGVSWRLQRAIGLSRAREMLLTGRPMTAEEAYRSGLASHIVDDSELQSCGASLAEDMLKAAPDALRVSKRAFDASLEIPSSNSRSRSRSAARFHGAPDGRRRISGPVEESRERTKVKSACRAAH